MPEDEIWKPESAPDLLRPRVARQLALPWRERGFLYSAYERLLRRLADESRYRVVPLREFGEAPRDRVVVGLRHDVDERLESALELARLERRYGLRSTYFLLHTARYYRRDALPAYRELEALGHEVGWHNDLVTLQCVHGVESKGYLAAELAWLRTAGLEVVGTAAHGSYWCHALGYSNVYFFADFPEAVPGFPNVERVGEHVIAKGTLSEFGLVYEANHLGQEHYFSDARFDAAGRRWHPDFLELERREPGESVILLVHPCHWDRTVAGKAARTYASGVRRLLSAPRRGPAPRPASRS